MENYFQDICSKIIKSEDDTANNDMTGVCNKLQQMFVNKSVKLKKHYQFMYKLLTLQA